MKHVLAAAAAVLLMGTLSGCSGSPANDEPADPNATGQVKLNLIGAIQTDSGTMATIVIRNVFDPTQNFLIECNQKDHTIGDAGEPFCDELTVLPPGVYEVLVQSGDPNCVPEQQWYKVIVQPGETVELTVNLICGTANGGLDVIVNQTEPPVVQAVNFVFPGDGPANKYMCVNSDQDVNVRVLVTDSDTPCSTLFQNYQWFVDGVAIPPNPAWITAIGTAELTPGQCEFGLLINPQAATAGSSFDLTLRVSDGTNTGSITFPIHFVTCTFDGGM